MRYRENEPIYREVWDWDIILVHGDVKIIGRGHDHLDRCGYAEYGVSCSCGKEPKLSSPVVDENGRRLQDGAAYSAEPATGDGRRLLEACDGTEINVMSGKTYRLRGERGHHDGYAPGSIWHVYAEPEVVVKVTFWQRMRRVLWRNAS